MNSSVRSHRTTMRRIGLAMLAIAGVVGLLLAIDPASLVAALRRFDGRALLPLMLLGVAYYALQGVRWHLLLREVGAQTRVVDSMMVNLAGQAVSAVLPLGDLTRAMMMTSRSGVSLGRTAATVTIQELSFTVLVVAVAAPGLARLPGGPLLMLLVGAGVAAIVAMLTCEPLFARVRAVAALVQRVWLAAVPVVGGAAAYAALRRQRPAGRPASRSAAPAPVPVPALTPLAAAS